MKLDSKVVPIGDTEYTVQEISVGEMMPILPRLEGDEAQEAQLDLMKVCILVNGEPIGDMINAIGIKAYLKLAGEVMEVNGLAVREEGKD